MKNILTNKIIATFRKFFVLFLSIILFFLSCSGDVNLEYQPKKAPKLTFTKLTINKNNISKEELLKQIKEKEKEGFTIKNITISNDSFADIDKTKFSLKLKKAGTFTIKLILTKKDFEDAVIEATIEYLLSETLNFNKFTTFKSTITKTDILNAVTGKKDGFTIKSIVVKDNSFADVSGTAPNFSLTLKKAGDFTASIVLQKSNHTDVTLTASFSGVPQKLTFNKLTTFKTTITKTELLAQIPETEKAGYNLKSIVVKDNAFADVNGTAPDLSLTLKKIGDFKAAITLSKTDYLDVAITGAAFKLISKNLAFPNLKTFKQTLTKNDILKQIQGDKTDYTITKIEVTDNNFADVDSSTHTLTLKKYGIFAIKITLRKTSYPDKKINGQIEYSPKPTFTFIKLTTLKRTVTRAEIEAQINGVRNGYSIKNIVVDDPSFATINNSNFSLNLLKPGTFTATITMGKTEYSDITFEASFEGKAETLTFTRLSTYKKTITTDDILKQVNGASGYTLKSISINQYFAAVAGTVPNLSLTILKEGEFTANITLQKTGYFDAIIKNATFDVTFVLRFRDLKTHKKTLTKNEILKQIQGDKKGYSILKIAVVGNKATVDAANNLIFAVDGTITIVIRLIKGAINRVIDGKIEYEYRPKPTLNFDKLSTLKNTITQSEIEAQIKGDKRGYTLKNIVVTDKAFATVKGTAPNFSLNLLKTGSFTATITMGKADYSDVVLQASFEKKHIFVFDRSTQTITGIKDQHKSYFQTLTTITFPDVIDGIVVKHIKGYLDRRYKYSVFDSSFTHRNKHIETIYLPRNLKTLGNYAFYACDALTSITIPDSVKIIRDDVFAWCTKLTSITLSNSLTTIEQNTFENCHSLTSINIPDKVTTIRKFAFDSCYGLVSITIPESVIAIRKKAFARCRNLIATLKQADYDRITVHGEAFDDVKQIKVPSGSLQNYKAAAQWSKWASKMVGY